VVNHIITMSQNMIYYSQSISRISLLILLRVLRLSSFTHITHNTRAHGVEGLARIIFDQKGGVAIEQNNFVYSLQQSRGRGGRGRGGRGREQSRQGCRLLEFCFVFLCNLLTISCVLSLSWTLILSTNPCKLEF
jgi:hypothetical protein